MSENRSYKASCLCGSVTIIAKNISDKVGACHCGMCRKWGGGPALAVDCGTGVEIEGEENVTVYDSSPWAERAFCSKCGTHLFYRLKEQNQYVVPAGFFQDQPNMHFEKQYFIDKKPEYYSFSNETENLTEEVVFALYAPDE
jgi:hypothetical protein